MDCAEGLETAPLFAPRDYEAPSLFTPENLLREARRQKGLAEGRVPSFCVFDLDGDLVAFLHATGRTPHHSTWAFSPTVVDTFVHYHIESAIGGRYVDEPFSVLVAQA